MKWTTTHDVILCEEILVCEPYKFKEGSRERGQCWDMFAEHLTQFKDPTFTVKKRSVRERYFLIEAEFKKKDKKEQAASGISPESSELDQAIEDIIAMFTYWGEELKSVSNEKLQKIRTDQSSAEEMRKRAMERQGESKKRNSEDQPKVKRSKTNPNETVKFLQEKSEKGLEMKQEELKLKKQEQENMKAHQNFLVEQQQLMVQCMRNQQKQQADQLQQMQQINLLMMQQQQQQNQAMMALLAKFTDK